MSELFHLDPIYFEGREHHQSYVDFVRLADGVWKPLSLRRGREITHRVRVFLPNGWYRRQGILAAIADRCARKAAAADVPF